MIRKYLKQPYPSHFNKWRLIVSISLFIGLFILIFQPFGLSRVNGTYKFVFLLGYGLVTFFVLVVNVVFVQKLFKNFIQTFLLQNSFSRRQFILIDIAFHSHFY